jgi:hypothetical protein
MICSILYLGTIPHGIIVNTIAPNNPDGIPADLVKTRLQQYWRIGCRRQYTLDFPLTLTAGARIDNDERYGATINPRLGLVYEKGSRSLAAESPYMAQLFWLHHLNICMTGMALLCQLWMVVQRLCLILLSNCPMKNLNPQKAQTIRSLALKTT